MAFDLERIVSGHISWSSSLLIEIDPSAKSSTLYIFIVVNVKNVLLGTH